MYATPTIHTHDLIHVMRLVALSSAVLLRSRKYRLCLLVLLGLRISSYFWCCCRRRRRRR